MSNRKIEFIVTKKFVFDVPGHLTDERVTKLVGGLLVVIDDNDEPIQITESHEINTQWKFIS